jgi:peptide/nickel transport system substrate-binding protein
VLPGAAYRDMMANSKLSLFRASWVADYADPENYLALFVSSNFSPLGLITPIFLHRNTISFIVKHYPNPSMMTVCHTTGPWIHGNC